MANLPTTILTVALALTAWSCQVAAPEASPLRREYSYLQANFPCHEDEALVFIDTPAKDRTGCVSLDILRGGN